MMTGYTCELDEPSLDKAMAKAIEAVHESGDYRLSFIVHFESVRAFYYWRDQSTIYIYQFKIAVG